MTDEELKQLVASLAETQKETDRLLRESQREADRRLRDLGQQIGGLGEKFGSFTEGMAYPAMRKLLRERFGMTTIAPRVEVRRGGKSMEVDVLGYSNTDRNLACVVEVKSHLKEEGLQQMLKLLRDFPEFFPEHRNKKLFGILAAIDVSDEMRARVLAHGLYLARIHDDVFDLDVPEGFEPRSFQPPPPATA